MPIPTRRSRASSAVDELVAGRPDDRGDHRGRRTRRKSSSARADEVLPAGAILASNTSSIPITSLAAVTRGRTSVIGMHFFNPVPVLKLVEVIRAVQTSDETAAAIVRPGARPRQGAGGGARLPRVRRRTAS